MRYGQRQDNETVSMRVDKMKSILSWGTQLNSLLIENPVLCS